MPGYGTELLEYKKSAQYRINKLLLIDFSLGKYEVVGTNESFTLEKGVELEILPNYKISMDEYGRTMLTTVVDGQNQYVTYSSGLNEIQVSAYKYS